MFVRNKFVSKVGFLYLFPPVASGTLMHCSSHNNTLHVIHMIHSFWKVCFDWPNVLSHAFTTVCFVTYSEHSFAVPSTTRELPEDYVQLVKRVHESGGYGSRGYAIFLFSCYYCFHISQPWNLLICLFVIPKDTCMTGKEKKQTKTCCVLTQLLSLLECFMLLQRWLSSISSFISVVRNLLQLAAFSKFKSLLFLSFCHYLLNKHHTTIVIACTALWCLLHKQSINEQNLCYMPNLTAYFMLS